MLDPNRFSQYSAKLVVGLAVFIGLLPLGIYAALLGNTPALHAAQALAMLDETQEELVLIDVRPQPAFQRQHIAGSVSLPLDQILKFETAKELPSAWQSRTLLFVCDAGWLSGRVVRHLRKLGINAYSLRGGIQDWGRAWPDFKDNPYSKFELIGGIVQEPYRVMPAGKQAAAALALLWIKPTYMMLSAALSVVLLRRDASDLRLLGWGLLIFLIGEVFCAINYTLLKDNSYFAEYIHSYSMAVAFGLVAYALLEGLDERLVHFSQADKRCAMLPVCGPCVKYQPVRCSVRKMTQLSAVSLMILAIIPLLSSFNFSAYNTQIGPVVHYYVRPIVHQWYEAHFSPAIAIFLISLSLLVMHLTPRVTLHPLARVLICAGAGFFGFSLFRVTLGMIYAEELVWATFWEELTELMFIAALIYILWVFRQALLPGSNLWRDNNLSL